MTRPKPGERATVERVELCGVVSAIEHPKAKEHVLVITNDEERARFGLMQGEDLPETWAAIEGKLRVNIAGDQPLDVGDLYCQTVEIQIAIGRSRSNA